MRIRYSAFWIVGSHVIIIYSLFLVGISTVFFIWNVVSWVPRLT